MRIGPLTVGAQATYMVPVVAVKLTYPYHTYLPFISGPLMPPPAAPSYYMATLDPTALVNEGCALGQRDVSLAGAQDSVVILDFGYPQKYTNGTFGARGFASPAVYANTNKIAAAVENFGVGYINCSGNDPTSHLRIAIGTSNYPGSAYSSVTAAHGKAWATMVSAVNDWFSAQCRGTACENRVDAVGASDIELSWNTPAATIDWLNGYASVAKYPMYDYGALEGCPWLAHPTYRCNWSNKDDVLYAVWGSPPVQPLPEIYLTNGINAEQWYLMSLYSVQRYHEKIQFVGPLTQQGACQQFPESECIPLGNTPEQAWWQLYNLLNHNASTSGEMLRFPSDIRYLGRTK